MRRCKIKGYKFAAAIGYDPQDAAPRLLAKGHHHGAERIIALAREAGVEVVEDPSLAALLDAGTQAGDLIPFWCWEAAAKIIAFVQSRAGMGREKNEVGMQERQVRGKNEGYSG
ncbi:MAG: EscU/YscU/HrcU family type III secretion system export apparatus switch protein [Treponema sp.]|jgi:type III secretion system FlhB-like substrate exporter|nr:EscU/YscU/HrcU family type III secretion system export apparatus switch protein [Treponema sp.]